MKRWLRDGLLGMVVAGGVLGSPAVTWAQDDGRVVVDARLEGLTADGNAIVNVTDPIKDRSSLTWFAFIALGVLAAGALFKDSRRTHLD